MVIKKKLHGWLIGALADRGYQQRDLAKAWKVDDAVVSRFISSGKPDLTPERQMMLSQMLGTSNDQLLSRLYGEVTIPGVIQQLRPPPVAVPSPAATQGRRDRELATLDQHNDAAQGTAVDVVIRRAVQRLEELLGPGVRVSIHIDFNGRNR